MSAVATRAAFVVPGGYGALGGRVRSTDVSRTPRGERTAVRRRRFGTSFATRPSAASASPDDGETDDASTSADENEAFSPTSRLSNVCFVLCRPQGPANVGGIARVMNNFGVTDLRVVAPEPGALAPPFDALMDDGSDRAIHSVKDRSNAPFADEARIVAVHAAHLLRDAGRFETAADAVADCVFVAATTARPRENLPVVSVRDACADETARGGGSGSLTAAANEGKVAILFGNEATGLTNEELALANVGVMIPTAGVDARDRRDADARARAASEKKTKRYTGGVGPTSLNLSHAVGVCAYEVHQAMGETRVSGFNSRLITAGERVRLADELHAARRALDVLGARGNASARAAAAGEASGEAKEESELESLRLERLEHQRERRAIANVLNAGPIASRDAAALFALARRVASDARFSGTDAAVVAAARAFDERRVAAGERSARETARDSAGGRAAVVKALIKAVREDCGVSMTTRETERVIEALGKRTSETSADR